jgi:hypothetical protein
MNQTYSQWIKDKEPTDVLYRIKRGLIGYISYLAACEMNESFSEYILYEPILRILTARNFIVECEWPVFWEESHNQSGDKKRVDFFVTHSYYPLLRFAIEVKWANQPNIDVLKDYEKLQWVKQNIEHSRAFLCIFGRKSYIENINLLYPQLPEREIFSRKGIMRTADLGKTRFSCQIFELRYPKKKPTT